MNIFKPVIPVLFILLLAGCDSLEDTFTDEILDPDNLITKEDALQQNYIFRTPIYDIQVAIDSDVDLSVDDVLERIDIDAIDFLNCQFFDGAEIGFEEFVLQDMTVVPPLSELRVYVVPFNFQCDAVDKSICAGIHYKDCDLIIVAEEGFGRCGDLPLLKHEFAHRYGLAPNHSNQVEFSACSDPEDCGLEDFLDALGIFG